MRVINLAETSENNVTGEERVVVVVVFSQSSIFATAFVNSESVDRRQTNKIAKLITGLDHKPTSFG